MAQTDHYVVVNKPAGLDCQNSKPGRPSVVEWLESKYGFSGLVHRLDFNTSGLMLIARTKEEAATLTKLLQSGNVKKTYFAVVLGGQNLTDQGVFDAPIEGAHAVSHYKVLERFRNAAALEVTIETGRKHQIRRHCSDAGVPILGDHLYGKKGAKLLFTRPALHAWRLSVESRAFEAPIASDILALLNRLRTKQP